MTDSDNRSSTSDQESPNDDRPQPRPPPAADGFRHPDVSEAVSPSEAVAALREALDLLKKASDPGQPWQHARHVLDVTGDSLDVAGLALKGGVDDDDDEDGDGDGDGDGASGRDAELLGEVRWLSLMVSAARSRLLGDAYADVTRRDPPKPAPSSGGSSTPLVVYASQTGTAESLAISLVKSLQKDGAKAASYSVDIADAKDITLDDLASRGRAYFVVSTFGLGRPPSKAEAFYASLQLHCDRGTGGDGGDGGIGGGDHRALAGLEVAVAALGDSRFENFAAFGIDLAKELQALGARPMVGVMTMDGRHGMLKQREIFKKWKERIREVEGVRREKEAQLPGSSDAVLKQRQATAANAGSSLCCTIS